MSLLDQLQSFGQGASNSVAGNVSGPVDGLAWLMRKAGIPISSNPVGGSDWMAQKGLTATPQGRNAGLLGEFAGMAGPMVVAAKAPQVARGLLQMADNAMATRTMNPQTGAIVWHGSPHKFDTFDSSKIGTGEGAQAYGHGLYLADARAVADEYAGKLSKKVVSFPKIPESDLEKSMLKMLEEKAQATQYGSGLDAISDIYKGWINPSLKNNVSERVPFTAPNGKIYTSYQYADLAPDVINRRMDLKRAAERMGQPALTDAGNLYKVDLPDEHIAKMLDWDKPLSGQGESVQALATKYGYPLDRTGGDFQRWMSSSSGGMSVNLRGPRDLSGLESQASSTLRQAGIPGIRYLDGGSRAGGAGSSNYVVFPGNEGLLSILERNGQALK
jgi:hypothetical protein